MKFERHQPRPTAQVRNYSSRREQWRLLGIVLAIGLVAFLTVRIGNPARWDWLARIGSGNVARESEEIDTRLQPDETGGAPLGTFVSPQSGPVLAESAAEPGSPSPGAERSAAKVSPELLATIRDDTYFTRKEKPVWFALFAILKDAREADLVADARPTSFAQLFNQSAQYRGSLVSSTGTVRRAHRVSAPSNDLGIATYYQVWFQPDDNPNSPMVLYVLELPSEFPLGMDLSEPASVAGFYYKRWAYNARDAIRTAPTLLAKTIHWRPRPPAAPRVEVAHLPLIIGIAGAMTVAFLTWVCFRTRRQPAPPVAAPDLHALSEIAVGDPEIGGNATSPTSPESQDR